MTDVLFEDGDWRICRTGYGDGSGIYHKCGDTRDGWDAYQLADEWWRNYRVDKCMFCKETIPAEIQGLYILHNWDRP